MTIGAAIREVRTSLLSARFLRLPVLASGRALKPPEKAQDSTLGITYVGLMCSSCGPAPADQADPLQVAACQPAGSGCSGEPSTQGRKRRF